VTVPRTYLDFDLMIEPAAPGYRARVLDSPTGEAATDFSFPFSPLEMENFLLRLTRSLSDARRRVRRLESQERELVKGFGGQLFQAMFSGAVLGALQSSLNDAFQKDVGLRIRLRLTETPELAGVPWEYLFNPVANRFLSLSPDTPLIRYMDLPMPVRPLTVTPPLRVLVMISSPADFPQLDVGAEWDRLNEALDALAKRGLVTISRLPSASLASLSRPLRLDKYHIFHFIGHGGFDEQSQNGALALEDAEGRARLVSGEDFGVMLSDHHSLRLVILNACEGARATSSDPFAGVAQSLVQQGIPAVIAMQFEITDEAAVTFAEGLYAAIADGYPVDAALAESRRAIFASGNDVEWATPVLYTRSPNGQLFRVSKRSKEAERLAKEQAEKQEAERLPGGGTRKRRTKRSAITAAVATLLLATGLLGWLVAHRGPAGACSAVPGSEEACLGTQLSGRYDVSVTLDSFSGTDTLGPENDLWGVKDPEGPGPKDNWESQEWLFTPSDSTVIWTVPVERPNLRGLLEPGGTYKSFGAAHCDRPDPAADVERDFNLDDSLADPAGITSFAGSMTIHWKCLRGDSVDATFSITGTRLD
jgi:hypothetical protein